MGSITQVSPIRKRIQEAMQFSQSKRQSLAARPTGEEDERPLIITRGKAAIMANNGASVFEVIHKLMAKTPPRTYQMLLAAEEEVRPTNRTFPVGFPSA